MFCKKSAEHSPRTAEAGELKLADGFRKIDQAPFRGEIEQAECPCDAKATLFR